MTTISHNQQCQDQGWAPTDWTPRNQWMNSLAPASSNLLLSVLKTITPETFLQNVNDAKTSFLFFFLNLSLNFSEALKPTVFFLQHVIISHLSDYLALDWVLATHSDTVLYLDVILFTSPSHPLLKSIKPKCHSNPVHSRAVLPMQGL